MNSVYCFPFVGFMHIFSSLQFDRGTLLILGFQQPAIGEGKFCRNHQIFIFGFECIAKDIEG
jgi:hypothetical protein